MQATIDLLTPILNMTLATIGGVNVTLGYGMGLTVLFMVVVFAARWLIGGTR